MKKTTLITLILLFLVITNIKYVNADGDGTEMSDVGYDIIPTPSTPSDPEPGDGSGSGNSCENSTRAVNSTSCGISASHSYYSTVYINIYNSEGKYIGNALQLSEFEFEAGRFVGIDAYESYIKRKIVTINPSCKKVKITCQKLLYYTEQYTGCDRCALPEPVTNNGKMEFLCSDGSKPNKPCGGQPVYGGNYSVETDGGTCGNDKWVSSSCEKCTPPTIESCHDEAKSILNDMEFDENYASYNAKRENSNDITKKETYSVEPYITYKDYEIEEIDYRTFSRKLESRVKYNTKKTCLNVKTGKVRYTNFEEECDENKELTVKNYLNSIEEPIGMYFIPLNAKSNTVFKYYLESGKKQEQKLCEAFITKYKSDGRWRILLLDEKMKPFDTNTSYDEGLSRVEKGCYYAFTLNFNIKQNFYNENDNKIRGYGSFYRPIDINNPFPNGLSATSIWSGLIDTTNNVIKITDENDENVIIKKYNLSDSFKEKSYSIYNINSSEIREYNHDQRNFYTSWEDMEVDGTSTFVNKYLTRYNNREYYKLGCGPANYDWEECNQ